MGVGGVYRERRMGRRLEGGKEKKEMRETKISHLSGSSFIPAGNMAFACATIALGLLKM